jgi:lipopolysaccharide transport system permease protein
MSHEAKTGHDPRTSVTVIEPPKGWVKLNLRELWGFRELIYYLSWRNVLLRYKQTLLGASWVVVQPLLFTTMFAIVFRRIARVGVPPDVPYALFAMSALIPWTLYQQVLMGASESLTANANLITKIYFPRLVTPISYSVAAGVDFIVGVVILGIAFALYGYGLSARALWAIPLSLYAFLSAAGIGLWLSALNVRYRDVRNGLRFLLQIMLFASPIAYSSRNLTGVFRDIYALNPMAGIADGFRWSLLGIDTKPAPLLIIGGSVSAIALVTGLIYFKRVEHSLVDVI